MAENDKSEKAKDKGLEAKVKDDYAYGNVTAFSGVEYVKSEWRGVPRGKEAEAMVHPLLDVREVGSDEKVVIASKDFLSKVQKTSDEVLYREEPEQVSEPLADPDTDDIEVESTDSAPDEEVTDKKTQRGTSRKKSTRKNK